MIQSKTKCEDDGNNVIDNTIIKKFLDKARTIERRVDKLYQTILDEEERKHKNQRELLAKFELWNSIALHTLTSYVSKIQKDLGFILYSIEYALRNISIHLKNSAPTKLKLLNSEMVDKDFERLTSANMPFTRMFIKVLLRNDSVGMMICRRSGNSIIKLVGREETPFVIVLNTPPCLTFQATYGCSWAIYRHKIGNESPFIQGCNAESTGYAVIGSTTAIVIALKGTDEVMEFILDSHSGNFIQSGPLRLPEYSPTFIFDDSKIKEYSSKLQAWMVKKKNDEEYKSWYTGQFIVDMNRIIHHGGIYLAPSEELKPAGKLRLIFDCVPVAYIIEKIGGKTTDGLGRNCLKQKPSGTRDHTPFFGGSSKNIEELLEVLRN